MSYRYTVSYSTSSTGPWTQAGTPTVTNFSIPGLANGNYFVQVIAVDATTGLQSTPTVGGPFTIGTVTQQQESPAGTVVTAPGQSILASQTPGQVAPSGGPFDTWTLTAQNGQAVRNGVTDPTTSSVMELLYTSHTVYREESNGNSLGTPGWWKWTGTTNYPTATPGVGSFTDGFSNIWTLNSAGHPVINGVTDTASTCQAIYLIGSTIWQLDVVNAWYNTTPTGTISAPPTWTLQGTTSPLTNWAATASPVGVPLTITGISLSNNTVSNTVPAGTTVGTVGVSMSSGSFAGSLSLSGTNASSFSLSGSTLNTAAANLATGNYSVNVTATQATASNSPFGPKAFTIVSQTSSGVGTGPAATSAFMTVDFTSPMNIAATGRQQVVTQRMNGCFIGWGGDPGNDPNLGPRGPDNRAWSAYSSSTWTSQAALVNFGVLQVTGNLWPNGWFNSDDTVNPNGLANLINNFYKIDPLGVAGIMWGMNFGYPNNDGNSGGDPTRYAKAYKNLATYIEGPNGIMPNGKRLPLLGFGSANEPDHTNPGLCSQFFNAFVPAVKSVNPNYLIKGPQYSSLYRGDTQTFLAGCNPKPDGVDWDAFESGATGNQGSQVYLDSNFTNSVGDSIASGVLPSGYTPKFSCGMGNTTFNCSSTSDVDGVNGAMFWAMNWFNGLAGTNGWDVWMGAWDDGGQGSCGIITDASGFPLSAAGYLFGMQVRNLFGPRWKVTTNGSGMPTIATTPGSGRFGLLIINPGLGAKSGTVALSHWPVNSSGTSTINMWKMTNSVTTFGQDGTHSTVSVTNGLTTSISFPDPSVTLLYV